MYLSSYPSCQISPLPVHYPAYALLLSVFEHFSNYCTRGFDVGFIVYILYLLRYFSGVNDITCSTFIIYLILYSLITQSLKCIKCLPSSKLVERTLVIIGQIFQFSARPLLLFLCFGNPLPPSPIRSVGVHG